MTKYTTGGAALPYPEGTDRVAFNGDMQALAMATDTALTLSEAAARVAAGNYTDGVARSIRAELAAGLPQKGRMPNGTDVNTLKVPGVYIISSLANAQTMVNLATVYPSIFIVHGDPAASTILAAQTQMVYGVAPKKYERISRTSTEWNEWDDTTVRKGPFRGRMPAGTDVNTLKEPGTYIIGSLAQAETMTNLAEVYPSVFIVEGDPSASTLVFKQAQSVHGSGRVYERTSGQGVPFTPWELRSSGSGSNAPAENAFSNEQRKQWFIRRRGGFIGTGGKAAVAIRIDHGAANMRDLVLPDLTRLSLPWGMAINPAPARLNLPESAGVTWADYNGWARTKGMEPWNHGHGHIQALTTAELQQQIVGGRDLLQENMPASAIEGWMVPGVGTNGYGGQSSTNEVGSFFDYEAGRLIMASHAVSSGYGGGGIRPQVGRLVDGQSHVGLDSVTSASTIISLIQQAQDTGGAIQLFLHPSQINLEGMTTPAVLKEVWEFLAAERDAGRLVMLSPSGLLLADPTTTRRHNLARFADFKTRNGRTWTTAWTNTTGWSLGADGVSTTTGTALSQNVPEALIKHCRGALYEIVAEVSSTSGATARIGSTTVGALKDVAIAAGQTREIRQHVTLPLGSSAEFNMTVGRVSGGDLTIKSVALQPV